MTATELQLIDGQWVEAAAGGVWDVIDPATEERVRQVPFGSREDCDRAIDAAARAFPSWSARTPYERAGVLLIAAGAIRERAGDLARTTVMESGKPLAEARGEWLVAADLFEWFAEEGKRTYGRVVPARKADRRMLVLRQPMGVAGVITAWNFPAYNPARAWAAALAAGCTVVGRPSEYTPLTAMALAAILVEAGLPPGVLNVVNGEPGPMGQAMLDRPECRKISFTGSVRVGRILMDGASRSMTRLSLELGGNAPVLVFPDADVEALAASAVRARFRNAGQVCIAPQRFLVHRGIAEEMTSRMVENVAALRLGHGLEPESTVGPLINAAQRDRLEGLVSAARDAGARIVAGGRRPAALPRGFFYEPTVLAGVERDSPVFSEELFGPVLPVTSFDGVDEAIELANATPYGLAAYVWTRDLGTAVRCWEGLDFGMVGVNEWAPHATEAPFAGRKWSGIGCESGPEGLAEYTELKLVSLGGMRVP